MNVKYITLISNSSGNASFKNTLSHFKTTLIEPIVLNAEHTYGLALHSISLAKRDHKQTRKKQALISVQCDQILDNFHGNNTISVHTLSESNHHIHEPVNKLFYQFLSHRLEEVEIRVNSKYTSNSGFIDEPTVVVLQLKQLTYLEKMTTILHLNSLEFELNSSDNFKCELPPGLISRYANCEIAVSSITFNPCFKVLRGDENGNITLTFLQRVGRAKKKEVTNTVAVGDTNKEADGVRKITSVIPVKAINIRVGESEQQIIERIVDMFRSLKTDEGKEIVEITYYTPYQQVFFKFAVAGQMLVPIELAYLMGYRGDELKKEFLNMLIRERDIGASKTFSDAIFDVYAYAPKDLMLYCNIIDVSPVGALLLPVLKTFPVKPTLDTNDLYCYEAKDLEFHRIQYTDINTLQMNMYTSYGAIPQFQNPKGKVQLTLAIRPRLMK